MKRIAALLLFICMAAGLWVGKALAARSEQLDHLIVASWGDGKYGKALYGAFVFYEERGGELQVKLSVRIDHGSFWSGQYAHDTRDLGVAKDAVEAIEKWGALTWSDQGLTVGRDPAHQYLFPRAQLENHR